jgi:hypothetical protein
VQPGIKIFHQTHPPHVGRNGPERNGARVCRCVIGRALGEDPTSHVGSLFGSALIAHLKSSRDSETFPARLSSRPHAWNTFATLCELGCAQTPCWNSSRAFSKLPALLSSRPQACTAKTPSTLDTLGHNPNSFFFQCTAKPWAATPKFSLLLGMLLNLRPDPMLACCFPSSIQF